MTVKVVSSVSVLIPLYVYPAPGAWDEIARAKQAYPDVRILAIVNPDSGPGASPNADYMQAIAQLGYEQVQTLGYVATTYGAKPLQDVFAEIDRWMQWYSPWGLFFDEVQADAAHRTYYQQINAYAKSKKAAFTVGNPGQPIPDDYVGVFDVAVTFEGAGAVPLAPSAYPKSNYAAIVYGVPQVPWLSDFGYFFATSEPEASAYSTISPLLWQLVAAAHSA